MGIIDDLTTIISMNQTDLWITLGKIVEYIEDHETDAQQEIFTDFLKCVDFFDFDFQDLNEQFSLSDEQFDEFKKVSTTAERIVQNLIAANVPEEEFYTKLWNKFNDRDLFPDADDRTALLLSLWLDRRIPYYQLGISCTMEEDEYRDLIQQLSPELKKASFIIYSGLQQKTQVASLLMDLADTIEDYRKKAVFWSCVISKFVYREAKREAVKMLEKITDESSERRS